MSMIFQCYSCDSSKEECDGNHYGEEKSCPKEDGCVLKKGDMVASNEWCLSHHLQI